jgi:hypothetical protein
MKAADYLESFFVCQSHPLAFWRVKQRFTSEILSTIAVGYYALSHFASFFLRSSSVDLLPPKNGNHPMYGVVGAALAGAGALLATLA